MRFENVVLESIALELPEAKWSSADIEKQFESTYERFGLSVGRLELMTGIYERRVWNNSFIPSDMATRAASKVLASSSIKKEQLGMLIHGGVCRDRLEPATAAYVHQNLGLSNRTQFFDVSNACLGFVNGMVTAANAIESGWIEAALIVTAENSRSLIENTIEQALEPGTNRKKLKQLFANFTIGSGACAAVLTHRKLSPQSPCLVGGVSMVDTSNNDLCEGGSDGFSHEMMTDSEALLKAGISLAEKTWTTFKEQTSWREESIQTYICHQVGKMHQNALYEGLKINPAKDFSTYPYLGNMGSSALPGTLALAIEQDRIQKGDRVALLGIGSGISAIILGMEW